MPLATATTIVTGPKFGRTYLLQVAGKSNTTLIPDISIGFPITLEFSVTHNIFAEANHGEFSLYGLSDTNRSEISFSTYLKAKPYPVILRAGYISQQPGGFTGGTLNGPNSLPIIFNGAANVAYTERMGSNLVTRIAAFDNGDYASNASPPIYFNSANAYTAPIGTPFVIMVREVMQRLAPNGIKVGHVFIDPTQDPGEVQGIPRVFTGRVWEQLEVLAGEAAGAHVYIENTSSTVNMIGQNQILPDSNSLGVLQSSTGLLGIPKYTDSTIMCSMIFEPSLTIGAQIELNSTFTPGANGPCKIVAYTHHGVISGVESGDLITDVTLMKLGTPLGAPS